MPSTALVRMPAVYIAGPYRGKTAWDIEENIRHAERFGLAVSRLGAFPLVVHANCRYWQGQNTDEFWLEGTLRVLELADAAVFIPRWQNSSGARAEHAKMLEWGRKNRVFLLDQQMEIEQIALNSDYGRLCDFIEAFKRAA